MRARRTPRLIDASVTTPGWLGLGLAGLGLAWRRNLWMKVLKNKYENLRSVNTNIERTMKAAGRPLDK